MKTVLSVVLALLCAYACQSSHSLHYAGTAPPFAHYGNLADALRTYAGLRVIGPRGFEKITIRQSQTADAQEPLYVINGQAIGTNYFSANQLIDMAHVVQIRVLKGSSESARFGSLGSGGVILVDTK